MFIFYKSYFEGEEMVTGFPLRGKELEEDERVMSSSSSGGGSGGGTGGGGGSSGNGCGGDREGDTNERPPKVQGVETAGFRPPLKDREVDSGGFDGQRMAGGWRAENAGGRRWGDSQGRPCGRRPKACGPLCRRRTWVPLGLGIYRRNEVLQAKMIPPGPLYWRTQLLQAQMDSPSRFIGELRLCRRRCRVFLRSRPRCKVL